MRSWRNWQTRKLEVLVPETVWRFKSSRPHQRLSSNRAGGKPPALRFLTVTVAFRRRMPSGGDCFLCLDRVRVLLDIFLLGNGASVGRLAASARTRAGSTRWEARKPSSLPRSIGGVWSLPFSSLARYSDGATPPMIRFVRKERGVLLMMESYTFGLMPWVLHQSCGKMWWMTR